MEPRTWQGVKGFTGQMRLDQQLKQAHCSAAQGFSSSDQRQQGARKDRAFDADRPVIRG
jgi:hypothetical protein